MASAREIAKKSPLAIASTKHLLNYGREHTVADTLNYQQVWMGAVSQGEEIAAYFKARATGDHDAAWKTFIARQPMGRMAQPEEMAHLAVYLASDESAYATGANFVVDGGITL